MNVTTYTEFRKNLASFLDKVNEGSKPMLITRQNGKPAVLMSLEDFHSYDETAYLMASEENAKRLKESIERLEAGEYETHELIED